MFPKKISSLQSQSLIYLYLISYDKSN